MNGTSLAALLGVATWFSAKSLADQTEDPKIEPAPAPQTTADIPERDEFNWSLNSLLQ